MAGSWHYICLSCQTLFCAQVPARAAWWTAKRQAYRRPPGRVQDVGGRSPTASCSSPWNATGTLAASSALAAKPSWGTLAPPATAKGAWFCVGVTTSGEREEKDGRGGGWEEEGFGGCTDCTVFCVLCFCRLFGHSGACSACGQSIPANEMVMRAQGNVYHLKVNPQLSHPHALSPAAC